MSRLISTSRQLITKIKFNNNCYGQNHLSQRSISFGAIFQKNEILNTKFSKNFFNENKRTLFSENYLGITNFVASKTNANTNHYGNKDRFFARINEYLDATNTDDRTCVFSDDLINCINLADDNEYHLDTLKRLIMQYVRQKNIIDLNKSFVHGPLVIRLLHSLRKPEIAMELLRNPELDEFFRHQINYVIAMDLLYKSEKFDQVIELFDIFKSRLISKTLADGQNRNRNLFIPHDIVTLVAASCYRMNTREALEKSIELITSGPRLNYSSDENEQTSDAVDSSNQYVANTFRNRRALSLTAFMAIKHNLPAQALQIISVSQQQRYLTLRNIKLLALANLGRIEDICIVLREIVNRAPDLERTDVIFKETYEELKSIVQKNVQSWQNCDEEIRKSYQELLEQLISQNHVKNDSTIEQFLLSPIQRDLPFKQYNNSINNNYINNNNNNRYQQQYQRGQDQVRTFNRRSTKFNDDKVETKTGRSGARLTLRQNDDSFDDDFEDADSSQLQDFGHSQNRNYGYDNNDRRAPAPPSRQRFGRQGRAGQSGRKFVNYFEESGSNEFENNEQNPGRGSAGQRS